MAMSTGKVVALIQAMGGGADPAVIEAKVQDWLEDHPEATTTVQDGSITEQKLATSIAQKLGLISSLSDEIDALDGDVTDLKSALGLINDDIVDVVNFKLLNGFDKNNSQAGTYNASGGIDASSSYTASLTYARVKPGVNYQAFYGSQGRKEYTSVAWYDSSFNFIRKDSSIDLLATAPNNAAYCRMSVPTANIETTVFVEGAVFAGYHDFGYALSLDEDVDVPSVDELAKKFELFSYTTTSQNGYLTSTGIYDGTSSYHSITTNQIPCAENDVFRYTGVGKWSAQSYLVYNSSGTIITYDKIDGTAEVTMPENAAKVVFSSFAANNVDVVLSVEKLSSVSYAQQILLNRESIEELTSTVNPLSGKKLAVTGDSICYGEGYTGGYAKIIGEQNGMTVQNIGVSGGTIVSKANTFCISESISSLASDADYVIVEGGFNDAASQSAPAIGSLAAGYNATYDTTTFYGAFETMLRDLLIRFQGKKIGYIFVHQATNNFRIINKDNFNTEETETSYYWAARHCCEKWGVPFCDLNATAPAFGFFTSTNADMLAIRNAYTKDGDGTHPNEAGYRQFYVPKITAWLKML